ncbi:histidine phosphatase family protein [Erwinia sp. 198]|uniref:histidine phosphatase family protein n=1 Tax=Erwinia sp. 198 TaxID=2022746 RepID=UPI000F661766|nr:histidine phosphatase family protein [Erwinia sp. 198]RRZ92139.1 histidine phosphatase family protein [Erwinia sp. 198]
MKRNLLILPLLCAVFSTQATAKEIDIYLVRHGKTLFNTTGQVQGWSDSPLTEQGILQARQAGKGLQTLRFTTAFSSDAGRARETAKLILEENQNVRPALTELKTLREWGYGGYEGRDDAELWQPLFAAAGIEFKKDWSTWDAFTQKMRDREIADAIAKNDKSGMAEDYDAIVARLKSAVKQVIKETEAKGGGNALVVSHGSAIPTLLTFLTPQAYHGESIGNASLTVVHYDNGIYTLKKIGDTRYLSE